jgi:tetratricopeptide (TPR) repeat protein
MDRCSIGIVKANPLPLKPFHLLYLSSYFLKRKLFIYTEEGTPEERALNFKDQGNKKLETANKFKKTLYYKEAMEFYTKGIAIRCADAELNCALHSNRAHVQLVLGNWRHAYNDARRAIEYSPGHLKSYFR